MQSGFRDAASQWCVTRYEEIVSVITSLEAQIAGPAVYTPSSPIRGTYDSVQQYYERWNAMLLPPDAGRYVTLIADADACAAVSDEAQQQTLALLELLQPVCRVLTSAEYLAAGPVPG